MLCESSGEKFHKQLLNFLKTAKGEKIDIASVVYDMILHEDEQGAALQFFLENVDDIESSEENEVDIFLRASDFQKIEKNCERLIEGILNKLIGKREEAGKFYQELWENAIGNNPMLESREERVYALYRIWIDGRIPYFQLEDGLKMSNDIFRDIVEKNKDLIKRAIFIVNSKFEQRTERSSLLNELLESCASEEDKAVVMAQILSITERNILEKVLNVKNEKIPED